MKAKLLRKFRKKADKMVTFLVCERDGVVGSEVRWMENRARFFLPSQYEEAHALFEKKYRERMIIMIRWHKWHLQNPITPKQTT